MEAEPAPTDRPASRPDGQHAVWEAIAASFDRTRDKPWPHVVAFLEGLAPGRVLDLMAGNGRHAQAARAAGHDVVAFDWSRPLCRLAAARGAAAVAGDATRLPFRDASFDACVYVAGLHGIPLAAGRSASLRELHRVLRPGGTAQITVWSRRAPRFADVAGEGPVDVVVPWRADGMDAERTYHLYTPGALRAAVEAAGLEVLALDEVAIAADRPDNLVVVARRP